MGPSTCPPISAILPNHSHNLNGLQGKQVVISLWPMRWVTLDADFSGIGPILLVSTFVFIVRQRIILSE